MAATVAVVSSGRPKPDDTSTATKADPPGGGGGGYSSSGHVYPPGATLKELAWDDKVKTLKDFVASYRLPIVARVRSGDLSKFLPPCGPNQDNVVQIHEMRRRKIVLARRLQWEKRQNDYIVSGEQVEVPASFKGWFEVVPDDGRPVEYFDTVGGICSIKPRRFLVRTSTVGYQLSIEDGVSCWMPHEIRPGEVLTTGMVYMDNNNNNNSGASGKKGKGNSASSNTTNNKGFFKRLLKSSKNKNKPEQDLKYLQCFDAEGKEIMIPLIMSGVFSPVGDASMANYDAVYELQDLIMAFGLPVNAQLIHANAKEKASCPQGVLRLYGTREEELAILSRVEKDSVIADPAVEKVEVSVERDITLQRGLPQRRQSMHSARPTPISPPTIDLDPTVSQSEDSAQQSKVLTDVELPKRVPKELKKSKSSGLLDKLSVRKVRRERAKLKELKSDDVFSKRIIRSDLSYEDFFNGLDKEEEGSTTNKNTETEEGNTKSSPNTDTKPKSPYGKLGDASLSGDVYGAYGSARGDRKYSMQDRDLPPIPVDSPRSSGRHDSSQGSKDSLYEHLPPAPQPPLRSHSEPAHMPHDDEEEEEEDGYMVPMSVRGGDSAYSSSVDVQLRQKPPTAPRDPRFSRLKKCRSEMLPPEVLAAALADQEVDSDQPFSFFYPKENPERPYGSMASSQWAGSTSNIYGLRTKDKRGTDAVPAWWAEVQRQQSKRPDHNAGGTLTRKSVERLDLETRSNYSARSSKSRAQSVDPNATIRSHNLRKSRPGVLELFHFSDSHRDLRQQRNDNMGVPSPTSPAVSSPDVKYAHHQPVFSTPQTSRGMEQVAGSSPYGAVIAPALMPGVKGAGGYIIRPQHYVAYADSEPAYRKSYPKAMSVGGLSDSAYPKQGDDSAISMGSRGENPYGFNNESEYSYNEYNDNGSGSTLVGREDNWYPPDDISALSVHEVSRSLRYIGMKDRVVLRFANEQIDGSMLCSLDKRLLKEGFPELNALEIKKILDFVRGWRPKKR